jgi:uncharacterized membrane-anchored protein YitT (DUF2179 family)
MTCKGTRRSITYNVLAGHYTVEKAAHLVRVTPRTVKSWLRTYGPELFATIEANKK